jgi:hypothetical protein
MLKIIEVVVLMGAGIGFVIWQFRDLRLAREVTRKQREAEQAQKMKLTPGFHEPPKEGEHHVG